ncbi:MAG: aminoacyl-tRNA hydrolase [Bacteroidales bacterium]|nr:aminoacyl-tRNA hydrolase [Bacteroidales bacterium]
MKPEDLKKRIPESELRFSASRSGGPGGQNVNKVNTKVEMRFNVSESQYLTDEEKIRISEALRGRINSDGDLLIVSQSERTQLMNKKRAEERFYKLLSMVLTVQKQRKATSPTKASKKKRIEKKKKQSEIKRLRKDTNLSEEI